MADGYAITTLDELGDGCGFRKVRRALGLGVGGKDGYVERDRRLVDPERDLERRRAFAGSGG